MDAELAQELRQLREAVERLRETIESAAGPAMAAGQQNVPGPEGRLRRLAALYGDGLITDTEFEDRKSELLAELMEA
jgi:hypothetical protein